MSGLAIGRVVHYVKANGEHCAAIVTAVWDKDDGIVNLLVLNDMRDLNEEPIFVVTSVKPDEEKTPGTWHWSEYVE